MNAQIQKQFNDLEKGRRDLFFDLREYNDELINKKPAPGAWSIGQVVEHVLRAEEQSLLYLQKKTQDTSKVAKAGLKSKWRSLMVHTIFALNIKYKAPAIVVPGDSKTSIKELEAKWEQVRKDTFELLNSLPERELKKEIWKHALAGKMDISQMLSFFQVHFSRHRKQVYRTLAEVVL